MGLLEGKMIALGVIAVAEKAEKEEINIKVEREEEDTGSEKQPTGCSEGEALANVIKFIQLADSYYR